LVLTPARNRYAKEEGDEQAGQGRFARDRCHCRERPSGLSRFIDRVSEAIDGGTQTSGNLANGVGHIGRCIDGAFCHAWVLIWLRDIHAQTRCLQPDEEIEAGTFGYPRERSF
jgi:hypothetical protein